MRLVEELKHEMTVYTLPSNPQEIFNLPPQTLEEIEPLYRPVADLLPAYGYTLFDGNEPHPIFALFKNDQADLGLGSDSDPQALTNTALKVVAMNPTTPPAFRLHAIVHECGHVLDAVDSGRPLLISRHELELARLFGFLPPTYVKSEIRAELTNYLVRMQLGLTAKEISAGYLKLYQAPFAWIDDAVPFATRASETILRAYDAPLAKAA